MWYYKTKLRTQRTPHVITVSHHYLSTSALTVSRDDNADSVADISPITVSSDILVRWESAVVTKKIKMSDKGYVLTANDSKNFTVKQLQILFHYFLTTDTAVISWFRLAHHDDWTSKEPGYKNGSEITALLTELWWYRELSRWLAILLQHVRCINHKR